MAEDGQKAELTAMQKLAAIKETGFWILAIVGAASLVYDIGWYGSLIATLR
jgi:hypothetical protein